jgi:hypothetical protein
MTANNVVRVDFAKKEDEMRSGLKRLVAIAEDITANPEKYLEKATVEIVRLNAQIDELKTTCFPPFKATYHPTDSLAESMETIVVYKSDYKRWRETEELILKL